MKKTTTKNRKVQTSEKLQLRTDVVRELESKELQQINGGALPSALVGL